MTSGWPVPPGGFTHDVRTARTVFGAGGAVQVGAEVAVLEPADPCPFTAGDVAGILRRTVVGDRPRPAGAVGGE